MKVLHIIDALNAGGAERICIDLVNLLKKHGQQVSLLLITGGGVLTETINPDVQIISLERKARFSPGKMIRLSDIMAQYDLIHVHMRHNFRYVSLVNLFKKHPAVILHDHSPIVDGNDLRIPFGLDTVFKPDNYIGVSEALTGWAKNQLKLKQENIFLLENTVKRDLLFVTDQIAKGLVLVSNIKPAKNQDFILKVLHGTAHHISFYGGVQDESYFSAIQTATTELGLENQVTFVDNVFSVQQELPKYRLGIHTSISESGPLVLVEYLAQHLPFLAYKTGNVAKKLAVEFPEFFLDNLEPASWRERIELLLSGEVDHDKMDYVFEKYFSEKAYLEKCLQIYRKVLN